MSLNRLLRVVLALTTAFLVSTVLRASPAVAEIAYPDGEVLVIGAGTASARPDVLRVTVGVEVTAPTVDAAWHSANETAGRVLAALRENGVADEDLQTAALTIRTRYDNEGRKITGFIVREDVTVKLRDLDRAGATIGAAVDAGGDAARLSGVAFELEDDRDLLRVARERAYVDARRKAEQYADLADRDLGPIITIRESVRDGTFPDNPSFEPRALAATIEPGRTEVTVTVEVRWQLH